VINIAVLGSGPIGHALGALLGSRPEYRVRLWGRRVPRRVPLTLECFGREGLYAVGAVSAEPSIRRAVDGAEIVVITVPAHVRHRVLDRIADRVRNSSLLLAWEGMGRFAESLRSLRIGGPVIVGLQRSPILSRIRRPWQSVEILGVRSRVVAATVDPADVPSARRLLERCFPFRFDVAPTYRCVSLSPANPLIHPARLYAVAHSRRGEGALPAHFYADWDDEASATLLALHQEVASLRRALRLPVRFVRTLVDGAAPPSPAQVTHDIRSEHRLAEIMLPVVRKSPHRLQLDRTHRFFREDIGEGLSYILSIAHRARVEMPTAKAIHRWYMRGSVGVTGSDRH
jgi:opine dehydrogenase